MKLETLLSVYKVNTYNVTTAEIKEDIPNVEEMSVEQAIAAVKKVVVAREMSFSEREISNNELNRVAKCNICSKPGKLITLARNRPAFQCQAHNTINPVPVELIKKLDFDYEPTK